MTCYGHFMAKGERYRGDKLSPKQLSAMLDVSEKTLVHWRQRKIGPPYYREVNRIFYYRDELELWRQNAKWA